MIQIVQSVRFFFIRAVKSDRFEPPPMLVQPDRKQSRLAGCDLMTL